MQRVYPTYIHPKQENLPSGLGWRQKHMLSFCRKYPGLHTIASDKKTLSVALSLQKRGYLHLVDCGMSTATAHPVYMVTANF